MQKWKKRDEERELIDEKVKHQVTQALQAQFKSFALEMTSMFSQMMMRQHHNPQNLTKRSASDIEKESTGENHTHRMREDTTKRRDNKTTPVKQLQISQQNSGNGEWHTPQYLQHIASQQEWTDISPQSQLKRTPKDNSLAAGINNKNRSESGDEDRVKNGSGIESINKSLENLMEAEATHNNHD